MTRKEGDPSVVDVLLEERKKMDVEVG